VAPLLHQVLDAAATQVRQGREPALVQAGALATLQQEPRFTPEYFEVADAQTLQPVSAYEPGRDVVLCLAAQLGAVRLIDNVVVRP
jgi:pantoate--beta-alanine ligase